MASIYIFWMEVIKETENETTIGYADNPPNLRKNPRVAQGRLRVLHVLLLYGPNFSNVSGTERKIFSITPSVPEQLSVRSEGNRAFMSLES